MNWKKSVVLKKARRGSFDVARNFNLLHIHESLPPILVNSLPKSGTHLLTQVVDVLGNKDCGNFIASTPSFTMEELSQEKTSKKLKKICKGELVSGHVFHSELTEKACREKGLVHYFIYRDPRDVIVSEVFYLSQMNKWHKLHKHYKNIASIEEKISLCIKGLGGDSKVYYPHVGERVKRFCPWLNGGAFSIRFEDLVGDDKREYVERVLSHYLEITAREEDLYSLVERAMENIKPKNSHTFRSGGVGEWKKYFTKKNVDMFNYYAGDVVKDMGY